MSGYGFPKQSEDAAHTSGDAGILLLAVRRDYNDTAQTSAEGDYGALTCNQFGNLKVQVEPSCKNTYMACSGPFTPAASATDFFELYPAGSSKVLKVLRIILSYSATMTAVNNFYLYKRSAANGTGGQAITEVALDSQAPAVTGIAKYYNSGGGNPSSVGAGVLLRTVLAPNVYNATAVGAEIIVWDAATMGGPIVLRGTSEGIALNNNAATVNGTSPLLSVSVLWTEEDD